MGNDAVVQVEMKAEDSTLERLDNFLAERDGATPGQGDRHQFIALWGDLAREVGITDVAIGYLYEGFRFAGAEPIYRHASELRDGVAYDALIEAYETKKNEDGAGLRMLLDLLGLELRGPSRDDSVEEVSQGFLSLNKGTTRRLAEFLSNAVEEHLVGRLVGKRISGEAKLETKTARALLRMLKSILENLSNSRSMSDALRSASKMLLDWLDAQNAAVTKATKVETPIAKDNQPDKSEEAGSTKTTSKSPVSSRDRSKAKQESATRKRAPKSDSREGGQKTGELGVYDVISLVTSQQEELETLKGQVDVLRSSLTAVGKKSDELEELLRKSEGEIADLRESRAQISESYSQLRAAYEALEGELAKTRDDLAAAEDMLTTTEERDAHKADAATQELARKLGIEYGDFVHALDLPMTLALGENLRDQLSDVFKILKSHGIVL